MSAFFSTLFVILADICFILLIIGLFKPKWVLLWMESSRRTRKKVLLYFGSAFLICSFFVVLPGLSKTDEERAADKAAAEVAQQEKAYNEYLSQVKKESKIIVDAAGVSEDQAVAIYTAIQDRGFDKITEITHDEGLDGLRGDDNTKGYRGKSKVAQNIIIYIKDGSLYYLGASVGGNESRAFIEEGGEPVAYAGDYLVNSDEEAALMDKSKKVIEQILVNPKSADFPNINHWAFLKNPDKYAAQSYVDAKNAFNADVRNKFTVYFDSNMQVTQVYLNGQQVY